MPVILPTIHLGGTAKSELLCLAIEASAAVQAAIDAVRAAAPHSRDYLTRETAADWMAAQAAHTRRLRHLVIIRDELVELMIGIDQGGHQGPAPSGAALARAADLRHAIETDEALENLVLDEDEA